MHAAKKPKKNYFFRNPLIKISVQACQFKKHNHYFNARTNMASIHRDTHPDTTDLEQDWKRSKNSSSLSFDVDQWLIENPINTIQPIQYGFPVRIGSGWTKHDIASYSHNDTSGLLHLSLPTSLPINLNEGLSTFVPKNSSDHAGVEILLQQAAAASISIIDRNTVSKHNIPLSIPSSHAAINVVTFRNNLNKLFGIPFNRSKEWSIRACFLSGTLFLDIVSADRPSAWEMSKEGKRLTAYGYIFESMCTINKKGERECANPNSEFGILVKSYLSKGKDNSPRIQLYIGAEIDCTITSKDTGIGKLQSGSDPHDRFCEMKTYSKPQHRGQETTLYRYKHPAWWLQSYLVGIDTLVLGQRDKEGLIHRIDTVSLKDLITVSRDKGFSWNPHAALCFGYDALQWMKDAAVEHFISGEEICFTYDPIEKKITAAAAPPGNGGIEGGGGGLRERIKKNVV